jgi:hypothetical protein
MKDRTLVIAKEDFDKAKEAVPPARSRYLRRIHRAKAGLYFTVEYLNPSVASSSARASRAAAKKNNLQDTVSIFALNAKVYYGPSETAAPVTKEEEGTE